MAQACDRLEQEEVRRSGSYAHVLDVSIATRRRLNRRKMAAWGLRINPFRLKSRLGRENGMPSHEFVRVSPKAGGAVRVLCLFTFRATAGPRRITVGALFRLGPIFLFRLCSLSW